MKSAVVLTLWVTLISTPVTAQEHGPQTLVDQFTRAWDASDSKAIGDLFAPDADLIAPDGVVAKGRPAIEAYYAAAFTHGYAGSQGVGQLIQKRSISNDLVLIDTRFTIVGSHKVDGSLKSDEKGSMAVILVRMANGWEILAVRERSGSDFIPFSQ